MSEKGYLIGEGVRQKLKATFARVDGIPHYGGRVPIPTDLSGISVQPTANAFRVCEITGTWEKGEERECTLYRADDGTAATVSAMNLIMSLPAPKNQPSRICNIGLDGTQWYLVSFEMGTATAVFSEETTEGTIVKDTAVLSYVAGLETKTITFASAGASVTVVTDVQTQDTQVLAGVSVTFNSQNCAIVTTPSYTKIKTVGSVSKQTLTAAGGSQTATIISSGRTQTAIIANTTATFSMSSATYTATYITLDI
jgi:hypothetical protein